VRTYQLANPLMHGPDLKPLQHALKADRLYQGPADGVFGSGTADACKRAKYRLGYPLRAVVPTGGQVLLNYLDGTVHLPPGYTTRRRSRGYGLTRAQQTRQRIVQWAHWGVAHADQIHYSMGPDRSDWLHQRVGALPIVTDCSGWCTLEYRWGGGPDPSRFQFRVVGFTGTMLDNGATIPLYQALPADLVIWGAYPGHHVATITDIDDPADPLIISHGNEDGPKEERLSDETAIQQLPFVVKRYIGG
jgi:peptidoglycan hydrolase-like protein with peptidoglycan-binding domain